MLTLSVLAQQQAPATFPDGDRALLQIVNLLGNAEQAIDAFLDAHPVDTCTCPFCLDMEDCAWRFLGDLGPISWQLEQARAIIEAAIRVPASDVH